MQQCSFRQHRNNWSELPAFGQALFERTNAGVERTASGVVFVRQAIALLNVVDEMEVTMHRMQADGMDRVAFGVGAMPACAVLRRLFVENLTAKKPLKLQCHVQSGMALRELLLEGAIEFAICTDRSMVLSSAFTQRKISELRVSFRV